MRACQRIQESESVARGPYTGSAGYLGWSGDAHWNILIRTLVLKNGEASVHAGSGIVEGSDPAREWRESGRKAQALLDVAAGSTPTGNPTRIGEVTKHGAWQPPPAPVQIVGARVLLVDNYDSFVHNLADYCRVLGAETKVVRNDAAWQQEMERFAPTHLVLGPGPGWPDEAGCTLELARDWSGRLPILGVCLGHQAIAVAWGGRVVVSPGGAVHGRADPVYHNGEGLFAGLPSPMQATRYHSLVVEAGTLGPDWVVDARLEDGTVMAIRSRLHETYGVQFHPESLCTESGLELLARFLGRST